MFIWLIHAVQKQWHIRVARSFVFHVMFGRSLYFRSFFALLVLITSFGIYTPLFYTSLFLMVEGVGNKKKNHHNNIDTIQWDMNKPVYCISRNIPMLVFDEHIRDWFRHKSAVILFLIWMQSLRTIRCFKTDILFKHTYNNAYVIA